MDVGLEGKGDLETESQASGRETGAGGMKRGRFVKSSVWNVFEGPEGHWTYEPRAQQNHLGCGHRLIVASVAVDDTLPEKARTLV